MFRPQSVLFPLCALLLAPIGDASAMDVVGGSLSIDFPTEWEKTPPKSRILEHELSVPAPEGADAAAARLTMMAAGGSVDANVTRWIAQFQGTDGGAKRDAGAVTNTKAGDFDVTIVDVSGTYLESAGGPFGPKTPRPGYRMLGAIIELNPNVAYFLKLVGPAETVDPASGAFRDAIATLRKN